VLLGQVAAEIVQLGGYSEKLAPRSRNAVRTLLRIAGNSCLATGHSPKKSPHEAG